MTNQTIDGVLVPRELLSYWAECLESAGFKDRPAEMRALLDAPTKLDESVEWVPTAAQIRHRRPERDMPDFGRWQDMPIKRYDKNRTSYVDSAGWECETRLLYLPVTKS